MYEIEQADPPPRINDDIILLQVHLIHFKGGVAVNKADCSAPRLLYPDIGAAFNNLTLNRGIFVIGGNSSTELLSFKMRTDVGDAFVELDRQWSMPDVRHIVSHQYYFHRFLLGWLERNLMRRWCQVSRAFPHRCVCAPLSQSAAICSACVC